MALSKKLHKMKESLYFKIDDPMLKHEISMVFGQYNAEMFSLQKRILELEKSQNNIYGVIKDG